MTILGSVRGAKRQISSIVRNESLGVGAYRLRRWKLAERQFSKALRRVTDRQTLIYAASVQDRLSNETLRDAYLTIGEQLFPSPHYDSTAAFAISRARPKEREEVAVWLAQHADALRAQAEASLARRSGTQYAFVYWDSEDQPDIVRHCIDNMRRNLPSDMTLVELNSKTVKDWVTIDRRILDMVDIPAHEADIIRLHLLSKYGGMWLDASCLLNPTFADYAEQIRQEDFFLFTYAGSRTGNWFIWGQPDSYRLQLIRTALDTWFVAGKKWTHYFQFHDVVEMLYWTDERYRQEWDAGLHINPKKFFECHRALGRPVTDEEWAAVRVRQPVNKLSWRKYNAPELRADPTAGVSRFVAEPLESGAYRPRRQVAFQA